MCIELNTHNNTLEIYHPNPNCIFPCRYFIDEIQSKKKNWYSLPPSASNFRYDNKNRNQIDREKKLLTAFELIYFDMKMVFAQNINGFELQYVCHRTVAQQPNGVCGKVVFHLDSKSSQATPAKLHASMCVVAFCLNAELSSLICNRLILQFERWFIENVKKCENFMPLSASG